MSLELARSEARKRPFIQPRGSTNMSRMAAVLTDGTLTFIGYNSYKSHPLQKKFSEDPECKIHVHAETDAIIKACNYFTSKSGTRRNYWGEIELGNFKLYVARVLADGTPALAKPCIGCQSAIVAFGIKEVCWT